MPERKESHQLTQIAHKFSKQIYNPFLTTNLNFVGQTLNENGNKIVDKTLKLKKAKYHNFKS